MALIQMSLIWVAYTVAVAILLVLAITFVFLYQAKERAASVSTYILRYPTIIALIKIF